MPSGSLAGVIPWLRAAALAPHADAELLGQFVTARDESAFELLVRRHGPMVFAVCRRVLRHAQDAEDAFQATFLVLARKAAAVSPRDRLAGWLYGVAYRTALKARHRALRRTECECRVPARSTAVMQPDSDQAEADAILDQELSALPELYRLPIILCDLQDRTRVEAAAALRCAEGTLSSRLTRGRRLLADRLRRRGVTLSAAALTTALASRAVAEPLVRVTVPAALAAASGAAGAVPPSVAELATGVLKSMFLKKLQALTVAAFAVAACAAALTGLMSDRITAAAPVPKGPAPDDSDTVAALADVDAQLLMNRKVLKELKCDFDQFDRIMDMLEAAQQASFKKTNEAMMQIKLNPNIGNVGPEGIEKMIADAQAAGTRELRKTVTEVVKNVLTPAQRKRLREIDLQGRSYEAFTAPDVAKSLDLTPKQKEQLAENVKRVQADVAQGFQKQVPADFPLPPDGAFEFNFDKIISAAREAGMKRALDILTDDQRAKWKEMTGEPFKHPVNRPWSFHGGIAVDGGPGVAVPALPLPAPLPPDGGGKRLPLPANPPPMVNDLPAQRDPAPPADPGK